MVTTQPTRIVPVPSRPGQAAQATAAATETGMENFMQLFNSELAGPLAKIAVLADIIEELRAAGFQNATILSRVSSAVGSSTSCTMPRPQFPTGSTHSDGRRW